MSVRNGTFYAPWPLLSGRPLNLQWGEIRSNQAELKAIAKSSVQELTDGTDELNAVRALLGTMYGDLDFRNKYRFFYNKTTKEMLIQKNNAETADATPEWSDVVQIRHSDGQFQVVSVGGIQSNAGFYGEGLQTIEEVAESSTSADVSIRNPSKIFFNSDDGFGVQRISGGANHGQPEIVFTQPFGKAQSFSKSGREWTVNHNFGISPVLVQVMDRDDRVVIPDKADVSDPNTAHFYFSDVFTGSVYIASGGIGASSLVPRDPFYLVVRVHTDPASPNNTLKPNADMVFDANDFYVNVDLDDAAGGAHKKAIIALTAKAKGGVTFTDGSNTYTAATILNLNENRFYLSGDLNGNPVLNSQFQDETQFDDVVKVTGGSAAAPAVAFTDDPDTGVYRVASDQLSISTGGTGRLTVSTSSIVASLPILGAVGSAAAPEFTFNGDSDTGMYRAGTNKLGFATVGSERLTVNAAVSIEARLPVLSVDGSAAAPQYSFLSDTDIGMYRAEANAIAFATNGTERFRLSNTRALFSKHVRMEDSLNVENTVTAEGFYLQPGSGGEISKSGDDVLIKSAEGQVVVDDSLLVTDKVVAEAFYVADGGSVNPLRIREVDGSPNVSNVSDMIVPNGTLTDSGDGIVTFSSLANMNVKDENNTYLSPTAITFRNANFYLTSDSDGNPVTNLQPNQADLEHGSFTGLDDNDHEQYVLRDQWLQNGFPDASDVDLAWDDASRTLTVSPSGASFDYFIQGIKYTQTGGLITETITDTAGLWMIYFDSEGSLASIHAPSHAQIDTVWTTRCAVAFLLWDGAGDGRLMYELHASNMAPDTHHWLHDHIGSSFLSGMALADFVADGNGSSDTHAQFSIASGKFADEDVDYTLATINQTTAAEIWYRDLGVWKWVTNTGYKVRNHLDNTANRLAYNNTASSGTQTEVTNGDFVLCHIFATNVVDDAGANPKYIAIQGQDEYSNLNNARTGADTEINNLVFGDLPLEEVVPVGTIIFQTRDSYTNAINARVRTTESGDNYIDWRASNIKGSGGSITDHGSQSGLADDDHLHYLLTDGSRNLTGPMGIVTAEAFYLPGVGEFSVEGLSAPNGSFVAPTLGFTSDPTSGFLLIDSGRIGLSVSGSEVMRFTGSDVQLNKPLNCGSELITAIAAGTAAAPGLSWGVNDNTGLFVEDSTSQPKTLGIATAGIERMVIGRDGISVVNKVKAEAFYVTNGGNLYSDDTNLHINGGGAGIVTDDVILAPGGAAGAPSYSFEGDSNTGFFRNAANNVGITTSGTARIAVGTTSTVFTHPIRLPTSTSAAAPQYSFNGDADTGMYRSGANAVGFATNGVQRFRFSDTAAVFSTHVRMDDTLNVENAVTAEAFYVANGGNLYSDDTNLHINGGGAGTIHDDVILAPRGTAGAPAYSFEEDSDLGMYRFNTNLLGFAASGAFKMIVGGSNILTYVPITHSTGNAATPSFNFNGDENTGIFQGSNSDEHIRFACNGVERVDVNPDGMRVVGQVNAEAFYVNNGGNIYSDGSDLILQANGGAVTVGPPTASAGDSVIDWKLAGSLVYRMGVDDSDGDKFKIADSGGFGATDLITLDQNGNTTITGDLTVTGRFTPRRLYQATQPASGPGATQIKVGELVIWTDSDDNSVNLVYNDTDGGVKEVSLA